MSESDPSLDPMPARRLASIDAYRGFVMFLLIAESLEFAEVARAVKGSKVWAFLAYHQEHVEWAGCTLHDMIQPSFSFLVGAALPFSLMSRAAKGQSVARRTAHAFWRAFVLVAMGIFLRSMGKGRTNFTFEDTLTQIGLGYGFLYLIGTRSVRFQAISLVAILVGYWAAFAAYPLPAADFPYDSVGVSKDWIALHQPSGFAAHWAKNSNLAWKFDTWFMNLFPREKPFLFNGGGYSTLSFLPTLGTMVMGLLAGGLLTRPDRRPGIKVLWLVLAGSAALGAGYGLGVSGLCPVVKRIWTPSWTLFSGGWCLIAMGLSYAVLDVLGVRSWAYPLRVIGANSIAAYLLTWLAKGFISENVEVHLGRHVFLSLGPEYEPLLQGIAVVSVMWLVLWGMYRNRVFLRV